VRAHVLAAASVLAVASPAYAQPRWDPTDAEVLLAAGEYFDGEYDQAWGWTTTGAMTLAAGGFALAADDELANGAAYPLLAVGAIQLGAGVVSFISPPRRLRAARRAAATDRGATAYGHGEAKRMRRVVGFFTALRVVEVTLLVGGTGLALGGSAADDDLLVGIGGGIAFQALAMLALDSHAEERAHRYLKRLSVALAGDRDPILSFRGTF
jgi:hypothetical protein